MAADVEGPEDRRAAVAGGEGVERGSLLELAAEQRRLGDVVDAGQPGGAEQRSQRHPAHTLADEVHLHRPRRPVQGGVDGSVEGGPLAVVGDGVEEAFEARAPDDQPQLVVLVDDLAVGVELHDAHGQGVGELAQQLLALTELLEDLHLVADVHLLAQDVLADGSCS